MRPYPNADRALRQIERHADEHVPEPAPTVVPWPPKLPRVDGERLQAAMQEFSNIISRTWKTPTST